MGYAAVESALRDSFDHLQLPIESRSRNRIYELICEYVDALRIAGEPPERVIVKLKALAHEAGFGLPVGASHPELVLDAKDRFFMEMVGWCIERYYASAAPPTAFDSTSEAATGRRSRGRRT